MPNDYRRRKKNMKKTVQRWLQPRLARLFSLKRKLKDVSEKLKLAKNTRLTKKIRVELIMN